MSDEKMAENRISWGVLKNKAVDIVFGNVNRKKVRKNSGNVVEKCDGICFPNLKIRAIVISEKRIDGGKEL